MNKGMDYNPALTRNRFCFFAQGIVAVTFAILFVLSEANVCEAAVVQNQFTDLAQIAADPNWVPSGIGGIADNTIVDAYILTNATAYAISGARDFLIEAIMSSQLPGTPGEAGARLMVRVHTDDLAIPNQFHEFHVRLQKEASDADNFVGIYNQNNVLVQDTSSNPAKIVIAWDDPVSPNPRLRIRLMRVGDEIRLGIERADIFDDDPSSQTISAALNNTNFPTQMGAPNLQEIKFGNSLAVGNLVSTWEAIHVTVANDKVTSLPYWPATPPAPTLTLTDADQHEVSLQVDLPIGGFLSNDVATLVLNTASGKLHSEPITDPSATPAHHAATFLGLAGGQTVTGWVETKDVSGRTTIGPSASVEIPPGGATEVCPEHAVTIQGTSDFYTTIQTAYTAAQTEQSIFMQAMQFDDGDLNLTSGINLALRGGYYCDFSSNTGMSVIKGKVTIRGDKVTVEKITIK